MYLGCQKGRGLQMDADSTLVLWDEEDPEIAGLTVQRIDNDFVIHVYEDWDQSVLDYAEAFRLYKWLGKQFNQKEPR